MRTHPVAGLAALATLITCAALVQPAGALDWPKRPVTVVVPLGAGGNADMMARLGAQRLSEKFGQPFVVENRPSAGGALGTGQVAAAAPDGYTILFSPASMLVLTPTVAETFPGFEFSSWNGFSVPAGTPEDIITAIRDEITALARSPEVSERLIKLGIVPGGLTKEETAAVFTHDKENFAASVRSISPTSSPRCGPAPMTGCSTATSASAAPWRSTPCSSRPAAIIRS
jgi:tripartite-type tricarboxylate transporter receptor subunit TctC